MLFEPPLDCRLLEVFELGLLHFINTSRYILWHLIRFY